MFNYNNSYDPILPFLDVTIINPSNNREITIQAIVDTGADQSCIPQALKRDLALNYDSHNALDFNNNRIRMEETTVNIRLQTNAPAIERLHPVRVYLIRDEIGIIGRDILNNYKVVLNAPLAKGGFDCSCTVEGCILSNSD